MTSRLGLVPVTLAQARAFVAQVHRHHAPRKSLERFAVGVEAAGELVGVAIVGNPTARLRQDGFTAEVTRLATTGERNACSMLYAACWRAARALGYRRLGTYILESEPGTSLRAAGWRLVATTRGQSWDRTSRPRVTGDKQPKQRWEAVA